MDLVPRQAVVLCGGMGSRLGPLTRATPKPLLQIGERPFLCWVLGELVRHGVEEVVLLAGFEAQQVVDFAEVEAARLGIEIAVEIEPRPAGTGGALWQARHRLDERFLMLNGDSLFDINLLGLWSAARSNDDAIATLALRQLPDAARFGVVECDGDRVLRFAARPTSPGPCLVNGGVYVLSRRIINFLRPECSIEQDVFPVLAASGRVTGVPSDGFFIDIGVPDSFEEASETVPRHFRRPAVFLDRDGVINEDYGHVGTVDRFVWRPGVERAIRALNDAGVFVFVVTNQAGVARGYYGEADVAALHAHIRTELAKVGAHIDDFRYCPFHPEGTVADYATASSWRKPEPGMLVDLLAHWDIDREASLLIGDMPHDVEAARRAGIAGRLIGDDALDDVVSTWLSARRP